MDGQERVLTLTNYGVDDGEDSTTKGAVLKTRVTVAPHMVQFIIASFDTFSVVDGMEVRKVHILMSGGEQIELYLSLLDLTTAERAVGVYLLP